LKKYRNLISSILSLFLTVFLLAFTIYGWYTSNKVVSTSGISGTVINTKLIDSVEYYNFKEKSTTGDTITLTIDESATSDLDMKKYDDISSADPTEFLIKINLTETTNVSRVTLTSKATHFIGFPNNDKPGYVTSNKNLSISSVIEFQYLPSVTIDETSVTYVRPTSFKEFGYNSTGDGLITNNQVDLLDSTVSTNVICILLNYNQDYLNDFYGNNIGNEVVEGTVSDAEPIIEFKFDFTIMVV